MPFTVFQCCVVVNCVYSKNPCACVCGGQSSLSVFLLYSLSFQSNPELTDMVSVSGQLALGIPVVFLHRLELQAG